MPEPLPLLSLHHVSYQVHDLARTLAFYRNVLGARQLVRPEMRFAGAWLFLGGVQIHLIASGDANPSPAAPAPEIRTTNDHIAFLVRDLAEVEQRLQDHAVEYRANIQGGSGLRQLFFRDPEGRMIEAAEYPPTPPELT